MSLNRLGTGIKIAMLAVALVLVVVGGALPGAMAKGEDGLGKIEFGLFGCKLQTELQEVEALLDCEKWLSTCGAKGVITGALACFIAAVVTIVFACGFTATYMFLKAGSWRGIVIGILEGLATMSVVGLAGLPVFLHFSEFGECGKAFENMDIGLATWLGSAAFLLLSVSSCLGCCCKEAGSKASHAHGDTYAPGMQPGPYSQFNQQQMTPMPPVQPMPSQTPPPASMSPYQTPLLAAQTPPPVSPTHCHTPLPLPYSQTPPPHSHTPPPQPPMQYDGYSIHRL